MTSKKIELGYLKRPLIDLKHLEETHDLTLSNEDREHGYQPFAIEHLQQYQPIYSLFFEMKDHNYNAIQLNSQKHIVTMNTVIDTVTNNTEQKQIFIKYSPLFDPIKFMIGKYNTDVTTQNAEVSSQKWMFPGEDTYNKHAFIQKKLESVHNASYVDGFFCYLSSKMLHNHGFKHAVDYYGSYLGIQQQYKMNIIDDYDYLINSTFFNKNLNKLFKTTHQDFIHSCLNTNSRANRNKLHIQSITEKSNICEDELLDLHVEELEIVVEETHMNIDDLDDVYRQSDQKYEKMSDSSDSDNNYSSEEDNDSDSDKNDEDCDDDDDTSENSSQDSDKEPEHIYAYIHHFPIQMILLEKCDGTLDELFESGMDEKHGASALFQVVMTLIAYQKAFQFTHNDLHTNNIMYQTTNKEFLYYKYQGVVYKVPTYGKIFKIIDFGRSIYHFQGQRFCSDSFGPGGDAATQYNCEPYFNEKKPRIEPNDSFDLCRLGTSIFDFIFDIDDPHHDKKMTPLQTTILRWCTDDSGKNVLYKRNGEERYPNFKLYKMISRNVHKHTPQAQMEFSFFKQFKFMGKHLKPFKGLMNIDLIV